MGELLAVLSGKGGTGKTSVCAALACALAEEGGLPGEHPPSLLGGGGQLPVEQNSIILPPGEFCKVCRGIYPFSR